MTMGINLKIFMPAVFAAAFLAGCAGQVNPPDLDPEERAKATTYHYNRGEELWKYGEYDEALKELEEAVRFEPSNSKAQEGLSWALWNKYRLEMDTKAKPEFYRSQGYELGDNNRWTPTTKYSEEEKNKFLEEYKRMEKEVLYPLLEKALFHARQAVLYRKTPQVYAHIARISATMNKLEEAKEALQEVMNDSTASGEMRDQAKKLYDAIVEQQKTEAAKGKTQKLPDEFPELAPPEK